MELLLLVLLIAIPLIFLAWLLPEKWQLLPLSVGTGLFLGFYAPVSLSILLLTTPFSYYILKKSSSILSATLIVIVQLLVIFLFFKLQYGEHFDLVDNRIIPLGLSYYAFRQIHYVIECYKKQLPLHTFWDYTQYLFFLPTLLVGPINRFQPFLKNLQRRRWDTSLFSTGLERILYGFVKIVVLGNYLFSHKLEDLIKVLQDDHLWTATYLKAIQYVGNSYVQFAGFSDVAIGLSLLFGFRVMENFNYPFLARNIADFWNRWHISLSHWCRDYVYYPFWGMSRNSLIAIVASMIVLAGWHEISWKYLLWGAMHAIGVNIWHRYNGSKLRKKIHQYLPFPNFLGIVITLQFVILSFVFVKEETLAESWTVFKILFGVN